MKQQSKCKRIFLILILVLAFLSKSESLVKRNEYIDYIKKAVDSSLSRYPKIIDDWKKGATAYVLWGFNPPGEPVYLADALGFLYEITGNKNYARIAIKILYEYSNLKEFYPNEFARSRIEYRDGVPSLPNFFFLYPYVRAYLRVKNSGLLTKEHIEKISKDVIESVNFISYFPEWGAHNRTVLRAVAYLIASLAFPDHPASTEWKKQSEVLIYDNLGKWEAEDATLYNGVWLHALLIYIENSKNEKLFNHPILRYYFEYYLNLLSPFGTIVDLGDSNFNNAFERFIACFEKASSLYRDGRYKYAAEKIFRRMIIDKKFSADLASILSDAYRWCDDKIKIELPINLSQEVLDDIVGKKIVFRTGWDSLSTFMLLNYRDEGDGNFLTREYLRNTIPVEEEKMHHGSSDENSIIFLMTKGSVLLHHAGYRDGLPSGMFGAFRADYFHNRLVVRKNKRESRNNPILFSPPAEQIKKQTLFEFIKNSGNYRVMKTIKIDFLTFDEIEYSRTRAIDEKMGYTWDRIICFLKKLGWFVVVDAVKFNQPDYYTLATLWHTQKIVSHGENYYDTRIDSIGMYAVGGKHNLLIYFPQIKFSEFDSYAKEDSFETLNRHFQKEFCVYQAVSSFYKTNDIEFFITLLIPHEQNENISNLLKKVEVLKTDKFPQGIGLKITNSSDVIYLCIKLDLEFEILRENIRPRYTFESGKIKYDEIETDAYFSYLRKYNDDEIYYAVSNFVKLNFKGKTITESKPYTFALQLDGGPDRIGYTKIRFHENRIKLK